MAQFGIDISEWQEGIDLQRAKNEGVEFVILRCGATGSGSQQPFTDSCFEQFYREAKNIGLPVGVYYYSSAHDTSKAAEEADYVIRLLNGKQIEYGVWYDIEDQTHVAYSSDNSDLLGDIIKTFCVKLEEAGHWTGPYSWAWLLRACGEKLDRFDKWICDWSDSEPSMSHGIWQFGGSTNVLRSTQIAGYTVDQNYAYKDYPALMRYHGKGGYQAEGAPQEEQPQPQQSGPSPQQRVIDTARSQVGYVASWGKHSKYAQELDAMGDIYNGPKDGYNWCDVFADWCYITTFGKETAMRMINQPYFGGGAGCWLSAGFYRANNQWSSEPSLGAQIFFGEVDDEYHTGIVVGYDDNYVYTIEGNTGYSLGYDSGAVLENSYYRWSDSIAGYGIPDWTVVGGDIIPTDDTNSSTVTDEIAVDGYIGVQSVTSWQRAMGTTADGVITGQSSDNRDYLERLRSVVFDWGGSLLVEAIQRKVGATVDGYMGQETVRCIQHWLNVNCGESLVEDGYLGPLTAMAIQRSLNNKKW